MIVKRVINNTKIDTRNAEATESRIGTASEDMLYEMLSEKIYNNPMQSFFREIVSNALDANIEGNSKKPIVIKIDQKDDILTITISDFGIGISPERYKQVFTAYLESTKREDSTAIGYFGLGKFSSLAVSNQFSVQTIHNGIEYFYTCTKGVKKPIFHKLYEKKTNLPSGTNYIVKIQEDEYSGYGSTNKISEINTALQELAFFENIYVDTKLTGYRSIDSTYINTFKLYKYKSFIVRDNGKFDFCSCFGRVKYELNKKNLSKHLTEDDFTFMNNFKGIGLYFDISDGLSINISRESYRYDDETCKIIKNKYLEFLAEIRELTQKSLDTLTFKQLLYNQFKLPLSDKIIDINIDEFNAIFKRNGVKELNFDNSPVKELMNLSVSVTQFKQCIEHFIYYHKSWSSNYRESTFRWRDMDDKVLHASLNHIKQSKKLSYCKSSISNFRYIYPSLLNHTLSKVLNVYDKGTLCPSTVQNDDDFKVLYNKCLEEKIFVSYDDIIVPKDVTNKVNRSEEFLSTVPNYSAKKQMLFKMDTFKISKGSPFDTQLRKEYNNQKLVILRNDNIGLFKTISYLNGRFDKFKYFPVMIPKKNFDNNVNSKFKQCIFAGMDKIFLNKEVLKLLGKINACVKVNKFIEDNPKIDKNQYLTLIKHIRPDISTAIDNVKTLYSSNRWDGMDKYVDTKDIEEIVKFCDENNIMDAGIQSDIKLIQEYLEKYQIVLKMSSKGDYVTQEDINVLREICYGRKLSMEKSNYEELNKWWKETGFEHNININKPKLNGKSINSIV